MLLIHSLPKKSLVMYLILLPHMPALFMAAIQTIGQKMAIPMGAFW